jgi:hypothetical protein
MPGFGRRVDGLSGRRANRRSPVVLAASAFAIGGSRSVLVADISSAGAKLQGRDLPSPATELLITIGTTEVFAKVSWNQDNECGLNFEIPLTTDQLTAMRAQGDWALATGFM